MLQPPESPTTARELDFDDDNDATTTPTRDNVTSPLPDSKSPKPAVRFNEEATEMPPQKPPRPVDANVQAQNTLIEAFPDIDSNVIKAVLVASGGKVEPAFNALLSTWLPIQSMMGIANKRRHVGPKLQGRRRAPTSTTAPAAPQPARARRDICATAGATLPEPGRA
jgi:hypothetical protein